MSVKIATKVELEVVRCCVCDMVFGLTTTFYHQRESDKEWFFCPVGHEQQFLGETDEERVRKAEAEVKRVNLLLHQERAAFERTTNDLLGKVGEKTKELAALKRRVRAGVCPDCHRHFVNLERHCKTKHGA